MRAVSLLTPDKIRKRKRRSISRMAGSTAKLIYTAVSRETLIVTKTDLEYTKLYDIDDSINGDQLAMHAFALAVKAGRHTFLDHGDDIGIIMLDEQKAYAASYMQKRGGEELEMPAGLPFNQLGQISLASFISVITGGKLAAAWRSAYVF
ncbi:MAG: hypothetical protein ACP5I3_10045 [Thermoproteus sp.]